jgi:hypothetical protein
MRATGNHVFRDADNIPPGKKWQVIIDEHLQSADVVVVFWSRNSAKSRAVRAEYKQAIKSGKDVIPVLLDSTRLNASLKEYQYIDFVSITEGIQFCGPFELYYDELASHIITRLEEII